MSRARIERVQVEVAYEAIAVLSDEENAALRRRQRDPLLRPQTTTRPDAEPKAGAGAGSKRDVPKDTCNVQKHKNATTDVKVVERRGPAMS